MRARWLLSISLLPRRRPCTACATAPIAPLGCRAHAGLPLPAHQRGCADCEPAQVRHHLVSAVLRSTHDQRNFPKGSRPPSLPQPPSPSRRRLPAGCARSCRACGPAAAWTLTKSTWWVLLLGRRFGRTVAARGRSALLPPARLHAGLTPRQPCTPRRSSPAWRWRWIRGTRTWMRRRCAAACEPGLCEAEQGRLDLGRLPSRTGATLPHCTSPSGVQGWLPRTFKTHWWYPHCPKGAGKTVFICRGARVLRSRCGGRPSSAAAAPAAWASLPAVTQQRDADLQPPSPLYFAADPLEAGPSFYHFMNGWVFDDGKPLLKETQRRRCQCSPPAPAQPSQR